MAARRTAGKRVPSRLDQICIKNKLARQGEAIMSQATDADEAVEKHLCAACIEDSFLRGEVERQSEVSECSYCGKQKPTISISIGDLAEKCHQSLKPTTNARQASPKASMPALIMIRRTATVGSGKETQHGT